jgi:hypothetical protein
MNQTSFKAIEGKTSFELLHKMKPSLGDLWEWGDEVWVHTAGGDKLGGQVRRGRWIRYDDGSNGSQIYYLGPSAVKIE